MLVVVHGGGGSACNRRRDAVAGVAQAFSWIFRVGTFNIEYRLVAEGGGYPADLEDVKCAVEWIAAHAGGFGLDGSRIAIVGESAGAQLALMAALTQGRDDLDPHCGSSPARLVAAIAYSAPTDLPALAASGFSTEPIASLYTGDPCLAPVDGCSAARSCNRCVDASPLAHACDVTVPILLVQAPEAFDQTVPEAQALELNGALQDAGDPVQLDIPSPAELLDAGCAPDDAALQAHGFTPCLFQSSGAGFAAIVHATVGP